MIQESNADRARLFEQAFSTKNISKSTANWKLNPNKAGTSLSVSCGRFRYLENDVAFEHLPSWIRKAVPSPLTGMRSNANGNSTKKHA